MDRELLELQEQYLSGGISRRKFLDRIALIGGSTAALGFMPLLERPADAAQGPAQAQNQGPIIQPNDNRLDAGRVEFDGATGKVAGYQAKPKSGGKHPAVIVIHENRGLQPHIEDVARRIALEGFVAYAPDLLSPAGGTPVGDDQKAVQMIGTLDRQQTVANLAAAVKMLASNPQATGKVGVVGFCWGGGMVNQLAAAGTSLNAAVSYYGPQIPATEVAKITCPLLLHYAGNDQRINAGIPAYEEALKANNKTYEKFIYEGAEHAFNNNTGPRYNKQAADLAWGRTIAFFKKYLA